ncbi:unnamed protein product [Ixodes persulcatus]
MQRRSRHGTIGCKTLFRKSCGVLNSSLSWSRYPLWFVQKCQLEKCSHVSSLIPLISFCWRM